MKKILLITFCALLYSCNAQQKVTDSTYAILLDQLLDHSVTEVTVSQISDSISYVYIDAREKNEYETSHIKNAIWVGYDNLDLTKIQDLNKHSKIIVYCSVGYRSEKVSIKLKNQGFTDVSNLYGGIFEWVNQNKVVYDSKGKTTKVHAYDKSWGKWLKKGQKTY